MLALTGADHLHFPATLIGVLGIHAEQIAGKNGRLVATGASADFEEYVGTVAGVFRQHQFLQFFGKLLHARLGITGFFRAHFAHIRIAVVLHGFRRVQIVRRLQIRLIAFHHRIDFRVLPGQITKLVLIADHIRVRQQSRQFFEPVCELVQLALQ